MFRDWLHGNSKVDYRLSRYCIYQAIYKNALECSGKFATGDVTVLLVFRELVRDDNQQLSLKMIL